MLETKGGKIFTLVLMLAVLVYTIFNYISGKTQLPVLFLIVFLCLTTGPRIVQSLIDDFQNK